MKEWLLKNKGKAITLSIVCIISFALFIAMQFAAEGFTTKELGTKAMFDSHLFYYSADYFYDTLVMMPSDAPFHYLIFHIMDYFFVISYYILMYASLRMVLPKKCHALCFAIPALPAVCDLAENISMDVLMANFPAQSAYASALGVWTCLKWYLGTIWLVVFIVFLVKRIRAYKQSKVDLSTINS